MAIINKIIPLINSIYKRKTNIALLDIDIEKGLSCVHQKLMNVVIIKNDDELIEVIIEK
jgi:hypothetical protein